MLYSVNEQLSEMKLLLEKVYAETQPNGGKTLRDNINNLNGSVKSLTDRFDLSEQIQWGLFELNGEGVFLADSKGNITRASDTICSILGCSEDEVLDNKWINFIDKDQKMDIIYDLKRHAENNLDYSNDIKFITKNRDHVFVNFSIKSKRDKDVQYYIGSFKQRI